MNNNYKIILHQNLLNKTEYINQNEGVNYVMVYAYIVKKSRKCMWK